MKKLLALLAFVALTGAAQAQTYPSPTVQNMTLLGGLTASGLSAGTCANGLSLDSSNNLIKTGCGGSGGGTVTSVGLALPPFITVTGSPITGSGTLTGTLATEAANSVFAGPASGSAAAPTFRAMAAADINGLSPTFNALTVSSCSGCTSGGGGTVTSVGLTTPAWLTVGGSPVTTAGTLAITGTSESANLVVASPNGSAGAVTPRALVNADLPATAVTPGSYTSANITVNQQGLVTSAANGSGGGGTGFSAITGGTNTSAAMVVGSGASIAVSGSGTVAATSVPNTGITGTVPAAEFMASPTGTSGTMSARVLAVGDLPAIFFSNLSGQASFAQLPSVTGPTILGRVTNTSGAISAAYTPSNGTDTTAVLAHGTITSGHCPQFSDSAGTIIDSGAVCGSSGGVTSLTSGVPGLTFSASTGAVTANLTQPTTDQSGAGAAIVTAYNTELVYVGGGFSYTIAQAGTTGFGAGWATTLLNTAASGNATITATTSTFKGASNTTTLTLAPGDSASIASDGTNYATSVAHYTSSSISGLTTNTIPKATSPSGIGNSAVTDNGTVVNSTEPIEQSGLKVPASNVYSIGWVAGQNPTNAIIVADLPAGITISSIVGRLEVAEGSAGTVNVYAAPSGTACASGGTNLTNTTNLNTNGTAATNQALAGTTTTVAAGSSLCLRTTGTFTTNVATVTVYANPT